MNDVTFMILKVVISVCVAIFTAYAVPYIKTLRNDARYQGMIDMITLAVRAAEQTITESGQGAVKKERVMAFARDWMKQHGLDITDEQLSELTEAAVWQLKQDER